MGALVCLEISLRLAGWVYQSQYYRFTPWPDGIGVLFLGESSTVGLWVKPEEAYPEQLIQLLQKHYRNRNIYSIVPPHIGQNTSQMSNRIDDYLDRYKPRLVVIMAGINNEWSLTESHINQFISMDSKEARSIRATVFFNQFRTFKFFRHLYVSTLKSENALSRIERMRSVLGHPEGAEFPPRKDLYDFSARHRTEFLRLWQSDLSHIIDQSKKSKSQVLLMSYHLNTGYLSSQNFIDAAKSHGVALVRNDLEFEKQRHKGRLHELVLSDHWHPSPKGYEVIAKTALKEITRSNLLGLQEPQTKSLLSKK